MTDLVERLRFAAKDPAGTDTHVAIYRDLCSEAAAEIERLRTALRIIAGYEQCIDNLLSHVEIARAALSPEALLREVSLAHRAANQRADEAEASRAKANNEWRLDYNKLAIERDAQYARAEAAERDLSTARKAIDNLTAFSAASHRALEDRLAASEQRALALEDRLRAADACLAALSGKGETPRDADTLESAMAWFDDTLKDLSGKGEL